MISALEKVDALIGHDVYDPMLRGEAARPDIGTEMAQRLRFGYSFEWSTHNCLHDREHTQRGFAIVLDPPLQILSKLLLNDTGAID